jgi:hypothetical protein
MGLAKVRTFQQWCASRTCIHPGSCLPRRRGGTAAAAARIPRYCPPPSQSQLTNPIHRSSPAVAAATRPSSRPTVRLQLASAADEQQRALWRRSVACLWRSSLASPPLQDRASLHGCRRGHRSLAGVATTGQGREHQDTGGSPSADPSRRHLHLGRPCRCGMWSRH